MNSKSRILVTGAAGLAGFWLRQYLCDTGYESIACLDIASPPDEAGWFCGSVCDSDFLKRVIREKEPELVFHLAGLLGNQDSNVLTKVNVEGTRTLLEALVACNSTPTRVLVTSSSAVYGDKGKSPVNEKMQTDGKSNYAISKLEQERVALEYHKKYGIPVIITRAFNNIAPGERESMFISKIAIQIAKIEAGLLDILEIGPVISFRDYLDTRDMVEAYALLIDEGRPGEIYNVCSGESILIEELFTILLNNAKKKIDYRIIQYDQSGNIPFQVGNADKLHLTTGWSKKRDIRKTVIEILDYWRKNLSGR